MKIREKVSVALIKIKEILTRLSNFIRNGEVYYINGADTLPPPLSPEEEASILERISVEHELSNVLVEHNLRLVVYIAKKFENTGADIEDLISIGTIGLVKAIKTFRVDKNIKLATYASRCIENEILMFIRKNSGRRSDVSIDEPLNVDWDGNELLLSDVLGCDGDIVYRKLEHEEDYRMLREAVSKLSEREQIIITLRFGLNGGGERTQRKSPTCLAYRNHIYPALKKIISRLRSDMTARL